MYQYRIYLLLFTVMLATACRMGRDYSRPEVALPQQYAATAPSDSSIAGMNWKQFFTDTTLQNLIEQALHNNYDQQLAIKRIEEAQAYVKQAKVNWLPALQAQVAASTTTPSKNSLNGLSLESFLGARHVEDYTANVGLSWELDIWGKLARQREIAKANYLQSYEAAHTVQTSLIANIANSYYNLLMLDEQLAIANKNLRLSDTIVNMIQLQKQSGLVTELAVQQATAQRQNTALLVPQLEQQVAIQENLLRILLGDLPGKINRITKLTEAHIWQEMPAGLPATLLSKRPDVRANEMALVAANAQVGVAEASMYPSLSITAAGGLNAFKASKWFVLPGSLFGTVAGNIAQPIFMRRQLKTQKEVAVIRRDEAEISFRQSILNAVGEVSNALVRLDKLKTQHQIAEDRTHTLQTAIGQAELLFKSGMADYLEVITAQGNSLQASITLADIQRQQLSAMVELYRSLGGGWN